MKVKVISKDSCQPIGTILEVSEKIVYGELTGQPMHAIIGKNENAMFIQSRYFEKIED